MLLRTLLLFSHWWLCGRCLAKLLEIIVDNLAAVIAVLGRLIAHAVQSEGLLVLVAVLRQFFEI